MPNKKSIAAYASVVFVLLYSSVGYSQNKNRIGLSGGLDKASSSNARGLIGISFERMVNKHNSAEIGVYYRTAINDNLIVLSPVGSNFVMTEQYFIQEKFISIPLVYNYKSNTINVSIGPSVDIYTGWEEEKHVGNPSTAFLAPLQSYKFDHTLLWGAIGKISKTIKLTNLLIEPAVYYNPIFTPYSLYSKRFSENRQYYGAVLAIKYVL